MSIYEFTFVVDSNPHAEDFEDRFIEQGCDDATFVLLSGSAALSFDRDAASYKEAVLSAYHQIKQAGANIVRFEPDFLVSQADIAERAGLTRSAIGLFAKGERRENFPKPIARMNTKNPLWDWVDVSRWLVDNGTLDECAYKHAIISRVINAKVQMEHAGIKVDVELDVLLETD